MLRFFFCDWGEPNPNNKNLITPTHSPEEELLLNEDIIAKVEVKPDASDISEKIHTWRFDVIMFSQLQQSKIDFFRKQNKICKIFYSEALTNKFEIGPHVLTSDRKF